MQNAISFKKYFIKAIIFGILAAFTPVIAFLIIPNSFSYGAKEYWIAVILAIIICLIFFIITIISIKSAGVISIAELSALIDDEDELYYLMINPSSRDIPKFSHKSSHYVDKKMEAQIFAYHMAQDTDIIKSLYSDYKKGAFKKHTFSTIMYGKKCNVSKILDKDIIKSEKRKIYKLQCIKYNGRKGTVRIPNAFPTFFK